MARAYAGVLGLLAMIVVAIRSLLHGFSAEEALLHCTVALLLFAVAGLIVGRLAEWIVWESVWDRVQLELGGTAESSRVDEESPDGQTS